MRRYVPMRQSAGTVWPPSIVAHARTHQRQCIGPLAGMPGACSGSEDGDHIRASHAVGMKSESIAINYARLCGWHHKLKTEHGKVWRPRLISVVNSLSHGCAWCDAERAAHEPKADHLPESVA